jgi:hypothetical protein
LGFVNQEDEGFFGIEGYYDEWLSGKPITVERPMIPPEARLFPDPPAGSIWCSPWIWRSSRWLRSSCRRRSKPAAQRAAR